MIDDCYPICFEGDIIIGDNQNFHVSGVSYEIINQTLLEKGILYQALPKYSPELNPIELIWAWLKAELRHSPLSSNLLEEATKILNQVTHEHMFAVYSKCGY